MRLESGNPGTPYPAPRTPFPPPRAQAFTYCATVASLLLVAFLAASEASAGPPAATITEPGNGATLSGEVTLRGTAYATEWSRLVTLVEVQVDAGAWRVASGTTAWSYRLDTAPLDDGWHNLRVRAFDGTEYSTPAGIEFQSRNAGGSGETIGFAVCIAAVVVLSIVIVVAIAYYALKVKSGPAGRPFMGTVPPPGSGISQSRWYYDQAGRVSRYPIAESPYYRPRPPPLGFSQSGRPPPRIYSPGGGRSATEAILVSPEEGGPIPPAPVVEHEGAAVTVSSAPVFEEPMGADAGADGLASPEVIEVGEAVPQESPEVIYMGPGPEPPIEVMPEDIPAPGGPVSGGDRRERVKRALISMPRGLPLPLLGITMDELACMITSAPRQDAPGGSPVVRLKGRWYRADEANLKDFMVEYKP